MGEETKDIIFLENEETEVTFAHGESDIQEDVDLQYEENWWNKEDDEPSGFTYKGKKKVFVKAVENVKLTMKKGIQKQISKINFKILDCRTVKNGSEIDIELIKNKERGIAILKIFGPNKQKECTLMISKSKKHDIMYVKILALDVIKPLIDAFISGEGWSNLLSKSLPKNSQKPHHCQVCAKGFVSQKNLNNHIEKFHKEKVIDCSSDNSPTENVAEHVDIEKETDMMDAGSDDLGNTEGMDVNATECMDVDEQCHQKDLQELTDEEKEKLELIERSKLEMKRFWKMKERLIKQKKI